MPTYQYVNKSGTLSNIDAADANTALSSAQDIGQGSGVMEVKTSSYPVVTAKAAQDNYNNIRTDYNDIKTSLQNQSSIIAAQNAQKEQQAKIDAQQAEENRLAQAKISATTPQAGTPEYDKYHGLPEGTSSQAGFNPSAYGLGDANSNLGYAQYQRNALLEENKKTSDAAIKSINDIQSGVIPLSPEQQAQIEALKQSFNTMIENQKLTNITDTGVANIRGYQKGSAEYDPTFQTKVIGEVFAGGQRKIAELNTQMAEAVAKLTLGFKKDNIQAVKEAYAMYQDSYEKRIEAINSLVKDAQEQIQVQEEKQKIAQDKIDADKKTIKDLAIEAANNLAPVDVTNKILRAQSVSEAIAYAGEYLQKADGDPGEYLFYRRDAIRAGITPVDYDTWADAKAKRKKATDGTGLPSNVITQIDKLSAAFDNAPITKQFNEVVNKKLTVDSVLNGGVSGPADLALVYEFMKALDPQSVVREIEYENARKSGNIFQGVFAKFNGYLKESGGFLPENVKSEFQRLIDTKFNVISKQYENLRNEQARKINIKTGGDDGIDYLTDYGAVVGNKLIEDQTDLRTRIDNVWINSNESVRNMIDELEAANASDEQIEQVLIRNNLMSAAISPMESIRSAISSQESGGAYTAVNKDSGALGRYQIMPFNLQKLVGLADTPENRKKFLNDPRLQDKAFDNLINELMAQYNGDIEKVLAAYYGGGEAAKIVGTSAGDKPQGGGKYPSINQYVAQVIQKINNV